MITAAIIKITMKISSVDEINDGKTLLTAASHTPTTNMLTKLFRITDAPNVLFGTVASAMSTEYSFFSFLSNEMILPKGKMTMNRVSADTTTIIEVSFGRTIKISAIAASTSRTLIFHALLMQLFNHLKPVVSMQESRC